MPSFDEIYEAYHAILFRSAYLMTGNRYDAEDVLQDTFLIAFTKGNQVRRKESYKAWLFRIMTHLVYQRQKKITERISGRRNRKSCGRGRNQCFGISPPSGGGPAKTGSAAIFAGTKTEGEGGDCSFLLQRPVHSGNRRNLPLLPGHDQKPAILRQKGSKGEVRPHGRCKITEKKVFHRRGGSLCGTTRNLMKH